MKANNISTHPIHLGAGATALAQPEFTGGMQWYEGYGERHGEEGADGRLVAMHEFDAPWDMWECHPLGSEVVLCLSGEMTLIQELDDGSHQRIDLVEGQYAINPPGTWHTADINSAASALFITTGMGTEHRPR